MNTKYKQNWGETRERYMKWWKRERTDRPLIHLGHRKPGYFNAVAKNELLKLGWLFPVCGDESPELMEARYTDINRVLDIAEAHYGQTEFYGEAYPAMYAHLGPGSDAVFMGCRPIFHADTIWIEHVYDDIKEAYPTLDHDGKWWKLSLESTRAAVKRAAGNYHVGTPDISGNLDLLSALLGNEKLLYYLVDQPDEVHRLQKRVLPMVLEAHQAHFDITVDETGWSEAHRVMGSGKVGRLQCDFSAMISPDMYTEFVLPYLKEQINWFDYKFYHLDGPGALCHLDTLLAIDNLDAIQWVAGDGVPDGGDPHWDFLYKKILDAGKGIYAYVQPKHVKDFAKRFGSTGVMIVTWPWTREEADSILNSIGC